MNAPDRKANLDWLWGPDVHQALQELGIIPKTVSSVRLRITEGTGDWCKLEIEMPLSREELSALAEQVEVIAKRKQEEAERDYEAKKSSLRTLKKDVKQR